MTRKPTPLQKMTETDIRKIIEDEFCKWNALAYGACQDPFWPDGVNMNLVRNHIIYWYKMLEEREAVQRDLFGNIAYERPIPPKVPVNYMVREGAYSNRLDWKKETFVWGRKGQYRA